MRRPLGPEAWDRGRPARMTSHLMSFEIMRAGRPLSQASGRRFTALKLLLQFMQYLDGLEKELEWPKIQR